MKMIPGEEILLLWKIDAIPSLMNLLATSEYGTLKLEFKQWKLVGDMIRNKEWGDDENRTIIVEMTDLSTEDMFNRLIVPYIDEYVMVSDS